VSGEEETTALAPMTPHGIAPTTFDGVWQMAERLHGAKGFIPSALNTPGAIAACILTGLELGLGPMQSLRSIHVIEGRPMLSADLMLSIALRSGVRAKWLAQTDTGAHVRLTRAGHEPHEHTFTAIDAKRAGLDRRQNWQRYPAAMLRARCISAALRAYCPDVLGAGVYVEGEIEADEPQVIDATPQVVDTPPPDPRALAKIKARVYLLFASKEWNNKQGDRAAAALTKIGASPDDLRGWLKDLRHEAALQASMADAPPGVFPDDGTLSEDEEARMERETAAVESATGDQ